MIVQVLLYFRNMQNIGDGAVPSGALAVFSEYRRGRKPDLYMDVRLLRLIMRNVYF